MRGLRGAVVVLVASGLLGCGARSADTATVGSTVDAGYLSKVVDATRRVHSFSFEGTIETTATASSPGKADSQTTLKATFRGSRDNDKGMEELKARLESSVASGRSRGTSVPAAGDEIDTIVTREGTFQRRVKSGAVGTGDGKPWELLPSLTFDSDAASMDTFGAAFSNAFLAVDSVLERAGSAPHTVITDLGTESVDGVALRHMRIERNKDATAALPSAGASDASSCDIAPSQSDVWVGGDGVARRLTIHMDSGQTFRCVGGDITDPDADQRKVMDVTVNFSDFDQHVSVSLPDPAQTYTSGHGEVVR